MQTLVLIKPDGVKRNLIGEIISRCEAKGYSVVELIKLEPSREQLAKHYLEHEGKDFYEPLMEFMLSGPIVAIALEGERVIEDLGLLLGLRNQPWLLREPSGEILEETGAQRLFRIWFMDLILRKVQLGS